MSQQYFFKMYQAEGTQHFLQTYAWVINSANHKLEHPKQREQRSLRAPGCVFFQKGSALGCNTWSLSRSRALRSVSVTGCPLFSLWMASLTSSRFAGRF